SARRSRCAWHRCTSERLPNRSRIADVLECPKFKGPMKLLALVIDDRSIARYLKKIGEPTDVPSRARRKISSDGCLGESLVRERSSRRFCRAVARANGESRLYRCPGAICHSCRAPWRSWRPPGPDDAKPTRIKGRRIGTQLAKQSHVGQPLWANALEYQR